MNVRSFLAVIALATAALACLPSLAAAATKCSPEKAAILMAAIDDACPCEPAEPWGKHRFYRTCTRKAAREIMRANGRDIPRSCLKAVLRCEQKSTCGEPEPAFTCTRAGIAEKCSEGVCSNDPLVACATNADCVVAGSCSIVESPEGCAAAGGSPGLGSCCAPETLPEP